MSGYIDPPVPKQMFSVRFAAVVEAGPKIWSQPLITGCYLPAQGKSFFAGTEAGLEEGFCRLTGREHYVRVVCVDFEGHSAWTQAIFLDARSEDNSN